LAYVGAWRRIEPRRAAPHKRQRGNAPRVLAATRAGDDNGAMEILLNGDPREVAHPLTVLELLRAEGLGERRVAVEVNGEIVPRGAQGERLLAEGDNVEIVHALGGG